MKQITQHHRWAILLIVIMLLWTSYALALSTQEYTLDWFETSSGAIMTGGEFNLMGIAGQSDSGTMSGGGYTLNGGFLVSSEERYSIFLPLVLRSS